MAEESDTDWRSLEQFSFGDSPELADELAERVLAGTKRATCWAAGEGPKTHVGKQWVVLDGSAVPIAVIETIELALRRGRRGLRLRGRRGRPHARFVAAGASQLFRPAGNLCAGHAALLRTLPADCPPRCRCGARDYTKRNLTDDGI